MISNKEKIIILKETKETFREEPDCQGNSETSDKKALVRIKDETRLTGYKTKHAYCKTGDKKVILSSIH